MRSIIIIVLVSTLVVAFSSHVEMDCNDRVSDCWDELRQPYKYGNVGNFKVSREFGSIVVCRELLGAKKCAAHKIRELMSDPVCQDDPEITNSIRESVRDSIDLIDYLCEQRMDDVGKHWNCLLDSDTVLKLLDCTRSPYVQCNRSVFSTGGKFKFCVSAWASDLGADILSRYMAHMSGCPKPDSLKSMLKRMWMNM